MIIENMRENSHKLLVFIQLGGLIALGLILFVSAIAIVSPQYRTSLRGRAAPNSTLAFVPSSKTATVGTQFPLVATITRGTNQPSAAELHISFDNTKLRLDSIMASTVFTQVLTAAAIDNTAGTGSIVVGIPPPAPSPTPAPGNLPVASFTFTALASSTTPVSVIFTTQTKAAGIGETANILTGMTPATVTIGGSGNVPTSTPTPPTITPVSTCVCKTDNSCDTTCIFDKIPGIATYRSPILCNLNATIFSSAPTSTNKNNWCKTSPLRTRGDADLNNAVDNTDYLYYVQAVNGGKIPPSVNPDFNGDGEVGTSDRQIVVTTLGQ